MANKVFVGNLSWGVDDNQLKELFTPFGEITEATIIKNKFNGRSKGFGFVTFTTEEAAQKAVAELNDKDVGGRPVKVSEAKPMDPDSRPPRRSFGGDRGGDRGGNRGGGSFGRRERY